MPQQQALPTIGFIGTGAITTALVTGLCARAPGKPYPLVVSPRSGRNAATLKSSYPERVTVARSMQEVADRSDWLVLAVPPEAGESVCHGIRFRPEHKVVNLLTDKTLPEVESWTGGTAVLVHMVPLTFNAFCDGPIVLCPPQAEAAEIFGSIGGMVQVGDRYQTAVLAAVTGCVTPFFSLLETLIGWARSEGVPGALATQYVTGFFRAVCEQAAGCDEHQVRALAGESTPGGINHMVKDFLEARDGFAMWAGAMEPVIKRLAADIPRRQPPTCSP